MDNNEQNNNNQEQSDLSQTKTSYTSNPSSYTDYSTTNSYGYQGAAPQYENAPLKQSKLGIASFIISLVSIVLIIVGFIFAGVFIGDIAGSEELLMDPAYLESNFDVELFMPIILMLVCFFASVGIAVVGLILGIVSVASKNVRKVFGIIGLILNALIVLGSGGFFIISLALAPLA